MTKRRRYTVGALAAAVVVALVAFGRPPKAAATVRVPAADGEIVESLPFAANDPRRRELAQLRRTLAHDPKNLAAAVRLARIDIRLSRERSDPRHLGHAQAALAPWWNNPEAPTEVVVLRATIEQSLHDFGAALADLDRVLARSPDDVQARLTRATVLTVRARYDEARADCRRVGEPFAAVVCETQIDSVTGHAKEAHERLASTLDDAARISRDEREWAVASLGEYAERMGDAAAAETHFKEALELDPRDAYVRGAYADLLIDGGRYGDAIALVRDYETNDALLLRLAIAEKKQGAPDAPRHVEMLGARFDAARARGDSVHRREEARFELELRGDREKALVLAKANWEVQKEPWDARILREAEKR